MGSAGAFSTKGGFQARKAPGGLTGGPRGENASLSVRAPRNPGSRRMHVTVPSPVLSIENLSIGLPALADRPQAVKDLSLAIRPGETLCVVGESGSGKSITALAAIGLLSPGISVLSGAIKLGGFDLLSLDEAGWGGKRRGGIGMVFQEPMTS